MFKSTTRKPAAKTKATTVTSSIKTKPTKKTTNKRTLTTKKKIAAKRSLKTSHQSLNPIPLISPIPNTQHALFSTDSTQSPPTTQSIPKIPKLKYLNYDDSTDILALLKSRGFVNQTTPTLNTHFNSTVDLAPESLSATLAALSSVPPQTDVDGQPQTAHWARTKSLPLYKPVADKIDGDTSTLRPNTGFDRRAVYAGFDPTAASLHLGNLLVIIALMHFSRAGHQVVALTGGATGMVGDPSGRSTERVLQSADQVKHNVSEINKSLLRLLQLPSSPISLVGGQTDTQDEMTTSIQGPKFSKVKPIFVDNFDWYHNMSVIDFLRDIGKHFRVSSMLAKDSVKSRMGTAGGEPQGTSSDGISYTEFSYQVLQGYDFNHLNQQFGVTLQLGGSDQWGNITAGIDNIHRTKTMKRMQEEALAALSASAPQPPTKSDGKNKSKKEAKGDAKSETSGGDKVTATAPSALPTDEAHGLTLPLLTTAQGVKFGKSMGNAVWINPNMTSSYQIFQYLLSTNDLDCAKFLSVFTFLTPDAIDGIMAEHAKLPDARIPQRILGGEVVRMLHGDLGIKQALAATRLLFKDKFDIDMSHYTHSFESVEQFENWETRPTRVGAAAEEEIAQYNIEPAHGQQLHDGLVFADYLEALNGVPITHLPKIDQAVVTGGGVERGEDSNTQHNNPFSILNLAVNMKLCASKSEAKRLIKSNGLSLFSEKITDENFILSQDKLQSINAPFERIIILKSGQKKIHVGVLDQ